jgi:hypothetical protein
MALRQTGFLALCAAAGCLAVGCVKAPFAPPMGGIVTSVKVPLQFECPEGGLPFSTASGSYSSMSFAWPYPVASSFAWDDCSIQRAAEDGDLAQVNYVDYEFFQVLGIFKKTTVTAYGTRASNK